MSKYKSVVTGGEWSEHLPLTFILLLGRRNKRFEVFL